MLEIAALQTNVLLRAAKVVKDSLLEISSAGIVASWWSLRSRLPPSGAGGEFRCTLAAEGGEIGLGRGAQRPVMTAVGGAIIKPAQLQSVGERQVRENHAERETLGSARLELIREAGKALQQAGLNASEQVEVRLWHSLRWSPAD